MDISFNLARHVARLVWLLLHEREAVDAQKLELRAVIVMAKEATARLSTKAGQLACNGLLVPHVLQGVRDLAERLDANRVDSIEIDQNVNPSELLGLARLLAGEPGAPQDPAAFAARLPGVGSGTVHVRLQAPPVTEAEAAPAEAAPVILQVRGGERVQALFRRLARPDDQAGTSSALDEIAFQAEQAVREGRPADAADVFLTLIEWERSVADSERRRLFLLTVRRLTRPVVLRAIAQLLEFEPGRADDVRRILDRSGEDGVDALVDQYGLARTARARRAYLDALRGLPATGESLSRLLVDSRVQVVRVAAELVGALAAAEGERPLAAQLAHKEPQVRRAVVRALARLDTPFALDALSRALGDAEPSVRLEAVAALAARGNPRAGTLLAKAIEDEEHAEVQLSLIGALGRVATPEALAKLSKAAEAGSGVFKTKKVSPLRLAAVQALGAVRTPTTMATLQSLVNDRDREVREAAARAVARPGRREA
jgi:hypothetical protein